MTNRWYKKQKKTDNLEPYSKQIVAIYISQHLHYPE